MAATIFALASARGAAGVAVVRLSGPGSWAAVARLANVSRETFQPRKSSLRVLRDGAGGVLDQALILAFEAGRSFTGEESAEVHLHGSPAVVKAVLAELGAMPGLRMAEPGEFTRRALENGRMDLAQVEGLSDLIQAETEAQRRQAMRVFSGALGAKAEGWRARLIRAAALIEATIDFADEDVPVDVTPEVLALLDGVTSELQAEAEGVRAAERIRDGFEVAIVGAPNAGKSTLLNALAGREAAITSEIAGTTRDVIEVRMDLCGLPVTILDTAGLRETQDVVEGIGVARALERAKAADLRVFLTLGEPLPLEPEDGDLVVRGKADLGGAQGLAVSGRTGQGVPQLIDASVEALEPRAARAVTATHERHRQAIVTALGAMARARDMLSGAQGAELAAEDLRTAIRALESLVGRIDVEHLLGEIFASFCIGK